MRIPHSKGIESIQEHLCAFFVAYLLYKKLYNLWYNNIFCPFNKEFDIILYNRGELRNNQKGVQ